MLVIYYSQLDTFMWPQLLDHFTLKSHFLLKLELPARDLQPIIERTCPVCKEKFTSAKDYRDHVTEAHDSVDLDPEFVCPDCGKSFRQYSNMKRHHRIHTGKITQLILDKLIRPRWNAVQV